MFKCINYKFKVFNTFTQLTLSNHGDLYFCFDIELFYKLYRFIFYSVSHSQMYLIGIEIL